VNLVPADDPILARPASPVTLEAPVAAGVARALQRKLVETRTGVALAAPQVGVDARMFVTHALVAINPSWTPAAGAKLAPLVETCLSLPERLFVVERWNAVVLTATDEFGNDYVRRCKGLLAQIVQHECDHLDGRLLSAVGTEVV
jgi:peptide deformylase